MRLIICGRGGQGVVTLNMLLGALASKLGHHAISAETHGMAMRGGSVYTSLKINEGASPAIEEGGADAIISMDKGETLRNMKFLKNDGIVICDGENDSEIGCKTICVDAKKIAVEKFDDAAQSGSIMLGKVISLFSDIFPLEKSLEILKNNKKINLDAVINGVGKLD